MLKVLVTLCHVPGEAASVRPQEVNMVCEGLCESMYLLFLSVHIDIIRSRVLEDTIHDNVRCTLFGHFFDMDDEVGSRHSLVLAVYEASFSPTDLTNHLKVTLECVCVLSRISAMMGEVIGYKSPVLEDNRLAGGQVRELGLSASRPAFPCHVCVHTNRWGGNI
jgi:hypothetical protein